MATTDWPTTLTPGSCRPLRQDDPHTAEELPDRWPARHRSGRCGFRGALPARSGVTVHDRPKGSEWVRPLTPVLDPFSEIDHEPVSRTSRLCGIDGFGKRRWQRRGSRFVGRRRTLRGPAVAFAGRLYDTPNYSELGPTDVPLSARSDVGADRVPILTIRGTPPAYFAQSDVGTVKHTGGWNVFQ